MQRRALRAALALSDAEAPVEEGVVAFAFLSVLRRLAQESPILLAVDDVQWLDAPSRALLGYAWKRLGAEPVAAVIAARGEAPRWLGGGERVSALELGPLSVGAIYELLRGRLDAFLPRPVLLRIWRASGGNPIFALELARALERRGGSPAPGEELPLPPGLEALPHRAHRRDRPHPRLQRARRPLAGRARTRVLSRSPEPRRGRGRTMGAGVVESAGPVTIGQSHLVGREDESRAVLGMIEAPEALPRAVVLAGDAGIGKTTVWLAGVEAAETSGYRVLSSRPAEAEARFSFAGLSDLVGDALGEAGPELPAPQRRALETALLLAEAEHGGADERGVAVAVLNTLRMLARAGPVLVAVDDVQWLDAPSRAVLGFALARLQEEPVGALLACRGEPPDWLRRAVAEERLLRLELGGLSIGALHEILRTRLETRFPRPVLIRLWERSGGNPFFALELARALERRGARIDAGEELPIPRTLEELLDERLSGLTVAAEEVARIGAVLAEPTTRLVEAVLGPVGSAGLGAALAARVLEPDGERLRFTHPLLASAIVARTPPDARRLLHARLAEAVSSVEERARHLALAASGPSGEAASALEEAARTAQARGAPTAAAELAEQALRLTPAVANEDRHRRMLAAADRHFDAGDVGRALAVVEEAEGDTPPGGPRAALLLRLGRLRAETSGADEAVALFREALEEAAGDDELVARILLQLGQFLRFTEGAEQALLHLEAAVEAAARVADDELSWRVLGAYGLVHFNAGRGIAEEAMERALALEASLAERRPASAAVHQLVWSGEHRRARETIERWRSWASERDHAEAASAHWYLALLEWRAGNWDAATQAAAAAVALNQQFGREATTIGSWPSAVVAAHRGEVDRAQELARRGLAAPGLPAVAEAGFEWVLGFVELSGGDHGGAFEHLDRAVQLLLRLGIREPAMQWAMPDLLDALLAEGEVERAERVLAPWEERARDLDRAWALAISARTRALIGAARRDLDGAFAAFDEALAEHARAQDPFQHARTLLALGVTRRRAKQRGSARARLEEALEMFERVGAPLWADKARAELARIAGRAPSRGGLTEAEQRIAALVAEGRTNREVAAALFLTEHTVATTLTRVYRKLGVRSRAELAGRLAHGELVSE